MVFSSRMGMKVFSYSFMQYVVTTGRFRYKVFFVSLDV